MKPVATVRLSGISSLADDIIHGVAISSHINHAVAFGDQTGGGGDVRRRSLRNLPLCQILTGFHFVRKRRPITARETTDQ